MKLLAKLLLICVAHVLSSCSSSNEMAPAVRKEQFYYGKSGVLKLVRVMRNQSVKELAHSYGIPAEVLARMNNKDSSDDVYQGEVIKVPMSGDIQFEERLYDAGEMDHYNTSIEGVPLSPSDMQELVAKPEFESLAHDIQQPVHQDELIIPSADNAKVKPQPVAKKRLHSDFAYQHPLNLKQFIWPVEGKVLSRYGKSGNTFQEGMSIAAPFGTVIKASADGEVIYVGNEPKVYGNLVIVKHKNNYLTAYAHLDKIIVKKTAKVKQGQTIGTVGKTGAVSIPQLYFSVRKDKKTVDPEGAVAQ